MYKKILSFLCIVVLAVSLIACKQPPAPSVPTDISVALSIWADFSADNVTGYELNIRQYWGDELVNSDKTIYKSNSSSGFKAYLSTDSVRLNHFGDEFAGEFSRTKYYFDNKIGEQEDDEQVVWASGSRADFMRELFAPFAIGEGDLSEITESTVNGTYTLKAAVTAAAINSAFDIDSVTTARIDLRVNLGERILHYLWIEYSGAVSNSIFIFLTEYTEMQVVIPGY